MKSLKFALMTVAFAIGLTFAYVPEAQAVCKKNEELMGGMCECSLGYDRYRGDCIPECSDTEVRDADGYCTLCDTEAKLTAEAIAKEQKLFYNEQKKFREKVEAFLDSLPKAEEMKAGLAREAKEAQDFRDRVDDMSNWLSYLFYALIVVGALLVILIFRRRNDRVT